MREKRCSLLEYDIGEILYESLGIIRTEERLQEGLQRLENLCAERDFQRLDKHKLFLAIAMVRSALERRESRGAHQRLDYPDMRTEYQKTSTAVFQNHQIQIGFREIPLMAGGVQ